MSPRRTTHPVGLVAEVTPSSSSQARIVFTLRRSMALPCRTSDFIKYRTLPRPTRVMSTLDIILAERAPERAVSALSAQLLSAYRVDCLRHKLAQRARRRKPVRESAGWTSLLCSADASQHLPESRVIARRHCSLALLRWGFSVRRVPLREPR